MLNRDEAFDNKWQLYRTDFDGQIYFAVWCEFIKRFSAVAITEDNVTPQHLLDACDDLTRTPSEMLKRFGISEKRVSHSIVLGKDFISESTLPGNNTQTSSAPLTKEQLKIELEAWTPRNLNIFFLEFIINHEIAVLEQGADQLLESLISDEEMTHTKRLEHFYKNILKAVNDAHFECYEATDIHNVNGGHVSKYDFEDSFKSMHWYISLLQQLSDAKDFRKVKAALQSLNFYTTSQRGTLLDQSFINNVLHPVVAETPTGPSTPELTPEAVILPSSKPITERSNAYNIGMGILIGGLLGVLAVGIAAAIIFTGGTAALLGAAAIVAILVPIGVSPPIIGGIIAALKSLFFKSKEPVNDDATPGAPEGSSQKGIYQSFGIKPTPGEVIDITPPPQKRTSSETAIHLIRSQLPQGVPFSQNPFQKL